MNQEKYLQDIREIREMMDRSGRFISLSGISGVVAGIIALVSAFIAYHYIYLDTDYTSFKVVYLSAETIRDIFLLALATLILSIGSVIILTHRTSKKKAQKLWNKHAKLLLMNLAIPLVSGGLVCLILILNGYMGVIAPLTLIFYGLALVNASKYTLHDIQSLGIAQIVLGLIGLYFIGYGLLLWAAGFGILHIIYGIRMHLKYGS
ncbi:hypothetical protein MATR_24040 [Marivirga tractuosa]|uniref:Uncharacterized protein n=1 Tax=Marivirga tractuosa (strain ATCC 23168 / DSM 4126 / NBRC 15989 / NCIMB 1408 / VKM B-1430 / H-43) TaxID=643867 RepID=E4TR88_MARTH|nr:hypothetical protein [Marivirga tractuosa]ADR23740.1 conserved hypothetical protein, membrane [Marivirga tractuosa DSM 4126]BDD15579.1 hypothetical protein MATR_24040 [Marivirga tractuosa]